MPRSRVPSYRLHKPSGQAVVTVRTAAGERHDVYLGEYDSPDSRREYARIVAELATNPTAAPQCARTSGPGRTVDQVLLAYWQHVEGHYRTHDGKPTSEVDEIRRSVIPLRKLYGHTPAAEFGPRALAAVRQEMINAGWCRNLINRRVERVRRMFRWATSEELVPGNTYQALRTLPGLQKGRTQVRESEPVKPVKASDVAAALPFLSRHVRAMVELQGLTGMRPGEVCAMKWGEVDRSGELWVFRPKYHKTAHRGMTRAIPIGPKARTILIEFVRDGYPPPDGFAHLELNNPDRSDARRVMADAYQEAGRDHDAELLRDVSRPVEVVAGCVVDPSAAIFSPAREQAERYKRLRAARKSKVQPSQKSRKRKSPQRVPSAQYPRLSYTGAIAKACARAGVAHWHPNQLRHARATEVKDRYGLEAAQVLLGHARADVTQVYAERNLALATKVAAEIG
jgi:integrase